jgi:hypothetical protein
MTGILCALAFINILVFSRGFAMKAELDSFKAPAAIIREHISDGDVVVAFRETAQGLGFYLGRRLVLAEAVGELEFGANQEEDPRWFIDSAALEELWNGDTRVFLVSTEPRAEELKNLLGNVAVIDEDRFFVVLSNFGQPGEKAVP